VGALVVLGGTLRFATLASQSLWLDEKLTADTVAHSFSGMINTVEEIEGTPPLYFTLSWLWRHLFGSGDFALRSLSALAGTATIVVVYAAGSTLAGRRAGFIAAALIAVSPVAVWYSQEARAYALAGLFVATSFWFCARSLRAPTTRNLAGWALACALAFATHYLSVFAIAAEALWLAVALRDQRRRLLEGFGMLGIGLGATVPFIVLQTGTVTWIGRLPYRQRVEQIPTQFLAGQLPPKAALWSAGALTGAALLAGVWRWRGLRAGAGVAAGIAALALGGLVLAGKLGADYILARNAFPSLAPLAVAVGAGFAGARRAGAIGAVALCAIGIALVVSASRDDDRRRVDWKAAASLVGPPRTGAMVVVPGGVDSIPLLRYAPWLHASPPSMTTARIDVLLYRHERHPLCWNGLPCGMVTAVARPVAPAPGFRLVSVSWRHLFGVARWRASTPRRVEASAVADRAYLFPVGQLSWINSG
jgi:hypothetical protein